MPSLPSGLVLGFIAQVLVSIPGLLSIRFQVPSGAILLNVKFCLTPDFASRSHKIAPLLPGVRNLDGDDHFFEGLASSWE